MSSLSPPPLTHTQVNEKQALKLFLIRKLELLTQKHSTQQTMLTTWLIELFLNELGTLHDDGLTEQYKKVQRDFHNFLGKQEFRVRVCVLCVCVLCVCVHSFH